MGKTNVTFSIYVCVLIFRIIFTSVTGNSQINQIEPDEAHDISEWLETPWSFDKEHVGIIFSLYVTQTRKYSDDEVRSLIEHILKHFNKTVVLVHDGSNDAVQNMFNEIWKIEDVKGRIEVTLQALPHAPLERTVEWQFSLQSTGIGDLFSDYLIPFIGNRTTALMDLLKNSLFRGWDTTEYTYGYTFNISVCAAITMTERTTQDIAAALEAFDDVDADIINFFFEENVETVKLGARKMFQQRVMLLEQCRKIVNERNLTRLKLSFTMLHYESDSSFYERKSNIADFVGYWRLLNDWAKSTKTTIMLSGAIDGDRKLQGGAKPVKELGWWRHKDRSPANSTSEEKIWVSKIEDVLMRFPKTRMKSSGESSLQAYEEYELVLISLLPVILSIFVIIMALYMIRRKYRQSYLSNLEMDEFFNGREALIQEEETMDVAQKLPYDKTRFEIGGNEFTIDDNGSLGMGQFGKVCRGTIQLGGKTVNVAIKMVNPQNIQKTTVSGFLSEIKVLSYVGQHENIIKLLGANTQDIKTGKVFIYLELCELGSLEKYLHNLRPSPRDSNDFERYENILSSNLHNAENRYVNISSAPLKSMPLQSSISQDLYRWSYEICNGMAYLATKHVVHADLATRNVLLNSNKTAKICDFGLSRRMYNYTNYVKQKQEPLPWKWMSPESLRLLQFNEKSDVWAYGITLWEIYALGDQPYPGLSWSLQFVDMLESGFRLGEPEYDDNNIYGIMQECWNAIPESRPTFADVLACFDFKP